MKKKILLLGISLFLSFMGLHAQMSYYYHGEKVNLRVDRNYVHIIADEDFVESSSFQEFNMELENSEPVEGLVKLKFLSSPDMSEYSKTIESLKQNEQVKYVLPFFERKDANPIGTSDIFYIKLKDLKDTTMLKKVAEQQNLQIVKQIPYMPLWYILSIKNSAFANAIDATNYFYETGQFEDIDPAFMFEFKPQCANDPMFSQLWGLKNNVAAGIDIDVCNAWNITRGAGINVAVVDLAIDSDHNDLKANFHPLSFNAQTDSLNIHYNNGHGAHVAGIIAAVKDNNLQVVGVAPESKIMRVSHDIAKTPYLSADLASGISWAWLNCELIAELRESVGLNLRERLLPTHGSSRSQSNLFSRKCIVRYS